MCAWVFSSQFARPQSLIGYGSRCDKLDQAETRSLLMCFLHIMKTISEGEKSRFIQRIHTVRTVCCKKRCAHNCICYDITCMGSNLHFHVGLKHQLLVSVWAASLSISPVLYFHYHCHSKKSCVYVCVCHPVFPDVLVSYWHRAIHQEISDFFNILE